MNNNEEIDRMSPFSPPDFTGVDPEHLMRVLRLCEQGKGDEVLADFEKEFAQIVGVKYAVAVSSASAGLHLSMLALEVGEGDEVICPTFTFAASAFPITYQGATPLFVDSEKSTWNISPEYVEQAIKSRMAKGKKPKALVVVHGYGTPADLGTLLPIAEKFSIPVVEDAANALGSTWKGKQVGRFGEIGVFSFNRNKLISAGSGGCVVTNDEHLAKKIRYFAHQAKSPAPYYLHESVGYNYGVSPILAELVRVQLHTLHERVLKRRALFEEYARLFGPQVLFQKELKDVQCNRWLTVLKGTDYTPPIPLLLKELEIRRVWKPMHTQPVFQSCPYIGQQESVHFFDTAISLPYTTKILSDLPLSYLE